MAGIHARFDLSTDPVVATTRAVIGSNLSYDGSFSAFQDLARVFKSPYPGGATFDRCKSAGRLYLRPHRAGCERLCREIAWG